MNKLIFAVCLAFLSYILTAGEGEEKRNYHKLEGIVFDFHSNFRVGNVNIRSLVTGFGARTNRKGEFSMYVVARDTLYFSHVGYYKTFEAISNDQVALIKMKQKALKLGEIVILDSIMTAEQKYQKIIKEYDAFIKRGKFNLEEASSFERMTFGLSIEAIYNFFSKQGGFARRFDRQLKVERVNLVIDQKFNAGLVHKWTGAEGEELKRFIANYRPTNEFIFATTEAELIKYIKRSYRLFKIAPDPEELPKLDKNSRPHLADEF